MHNNWITVMSNNLLKWTRNTSTLKKKQTNQPNQNQNKKNPQNQTTNQKNHRGLLSMWEINESHWILRVSFCVCYWIAEWMGFKSSKWEKSVQVIFKVKFLTQSYSTVLEFIIRFPSKSKPLWKVGNLAVKSF